MLVLYAPDPGVELLNTAGYCTTVSIIDARLSSTEYVHTGTERGTYGQDSTAAKMYDSCIQCLLYWTMPCSYGAYVVSMTMFQRNTAS